MEAISPVTSEALDQRRRRLLMSGGIAAGMMMTRGASAQVHTQEEKPTLNGQPVPEPPADKSAGPIQPGRGSALTGKVAIVTGAARGIGRAIAVEYAANGADVVAIDIAGPVSPASDATPATPDDLAKTVRLLRGYGGKGESIRADIRDINALRAAADQVEHAHGKIDIVVADAAIQRWKPLLEMDDHDWYDVIDNNLNGTANTIRAFAPKMVPRQNGRIIGTIVHAGTARDKGRRQLFGIQMGHPRFDEVGGYRIGAIQHNR